jgi:gamma-polyglutamate synthase
MLFQIVISSLLIFLLFLFIEKYLYDKRINKLTIRILVNGTRGKSSVTEFITSALNASGQNTIGKITGIIPTLILGDGTKKIIKRFNGARVQEQIKVVRFASAQKANALVLECMSIQAELQNLESRLFKPHIYVITNILNDHQEELGINEEEQANAICSAIPWNSAIITNEKHFLDMIKSFARQRNSDVYTCDDKSNQSLGGHETFIQENIMLALKVCELLNMEEELSEKAILKVLDHKTPIHYESFSGNTRIRFLNAFSANDVMSTEKIIKSFETKFGLIDNPIFIYNSRSDRPYRTIEFARWLSKINNIFRIYLIGTHSLKAKKEILKKGIAESTLKILMKNEINKLFTDISEFERREVTLIGIGNIAGEGFQVINHFIPENNLASLRL